MVKAKTLEFVSDEKELETWISAEDMIESLQDIIDAGWVDTSVHTCHDGYSMCVEGRRPATDKEKARYLVQQQKVREATKAAKVEKIAAEKKELERLLAKYGKDL